MEGLCVNPLFLRLLYISNIFLNVIRYVVPILLIIRTVMDIYKQVLDPNQEEGKKSIKNRLIACIIVFLIPTIIGVLFNLIENVVVRNSYNDLSVCREFANLDYITELEKKIDQEELEGYLDESAYYLSEYEIEETVAPYFETSAENVNRGFTE